MPETIVRTRTLKEISLFKARVRAVLVLLGGTCYLTIQGVFGLRLIKHHMSCHVKSSARMEYMCVSSRWQEYAGNRGHYSTLHQTQTQSQFGLIGLVVVFVVLVVSVVVVRWLSLTGVVSQTIFTWQRRIASYTWMNHHLMVGTNIEQVSTFIHSFRMASK